MTSDSKPRCRATKGSYALNTERPGSVVYFHESSMRCFYGVHDTGKHRNAEGSEWDTPDGAMPPLPGKLVPNVVVGGPDILVWPSDPIT